MASQRLLILACSQRKRSEVGRLTAIERYDGPAFRVVRRFVKIGGAPLPDIYVLSAQFGFIPGTALIPMYDRRMSSSRAGELAELVEAQMSNLYLECYDHTFVHAGTDYRRILPTSRLLSQQLTFANGSPGTQLAQLKAWLYQRLLSIHSEERAIQNSDVPIRFRLRGVEYEISPGEAVSASREAIKKSIADAQRVGAWYVLIDNQKLAPKWLVSRLTGMPVGSFHSDDAKRVLAQLGLRVTQE